jgi:S1-C subfamily serine protease
VNIYAKSKAEQQGFNDSQILGQGIVLTSDGWVLTTADVITHPSSTYEVVGYQNKEYVLGNFVQDKATGLVFGKIEGKNLPIVAIGKSKDLTLGQTVVVASQRKKLEIANIVKIGYSFDSNDDLSQSSDLFGKHLFVDIDMDKSYNGAIVATLKGEVVGTVEGGQILLSDYFSKTINDVLAGKQISHPELGITYIDLPNTEGSQKLGEQGAYVLSVNKASSAYGKLKAGDVIKKVNDLELNSYLSLSEAINNFNTGNKVELLFSRAGKDQSADVILK